MPYRLIIDGNSVYEIDEDYEAELKKEHEEEKKEEKGG